MLAEELRRLGRTLRKPCFLKDRRHVGVRGEALPARLVPVEDRPNPVASFGSRKTCAPLDPCCFRFSAPLVEKVFQNWSKSPIFAVARTIVLLRRTVVVPSTLRHFHQQMECRSQPTSGRVRTAPLTHSSLRPCSSRSLGSWPGAQAARRMLSYREQSTVHNLEGRTRWHTGSCITFQAVRKSSTKRVSRQCIRRGTTCRTARRFTRLALRMGLDDLRRPRVEGELGAVPRRHPDASDASGDRRRPPRTTRDCVRDPQPAAVTARARGAVARSLTLVCGCVLSRAATERLSLEVSLGQAGRPEALAVTAGFGAYEGQCPGVGDGNE